MAILVATRSSEANLVSFIFQYRSKTTSVLDESYRTSSKLEHAIPLLEYYIPHQLHVETKKFKSE